MPGVLTISLDFELFWGVQHRYPNPASYRPHLLGVQEVVPRLLEVFAEYDVRATWAVVGLLYTSSMEEAERYFPSQLPRAKGRQNCCYHDSGRDIQPRDPCYFAPDLIRRIRNSPGQEIACHGFAHLPYTTPGMSVNDVRQDVRAALEVADKFGDSPTSFVFPRNRFRAEHLPVLRELNFESYRDFPPEGGANRVWRRIIRFADAHWDFGGDALPLAEGYRQADPRDALTRIAATRFLRPATGGWLDSVRLRRITAGLDHAAREQRVYHLWWHPHNFGAQVELNLQHLRRILDHFAQLRDKCGMQALGMNDLATMANDRVAPS